MENTFYEITIMFEEEKDDMIDIASSEQTGRTK